jgi:3-methyladenine DNA glycosylase AlkC
MASRKGFSSIAAIPADVLSRLNLGQEETVTLTECLAVDQAMLWNQLLPNVPLPTDYDPALGIVKRMRVLGEGLGCHVSESSLLTTDTSRGWTCFARNSQATSLGDALDSVRDLACDPHFGVREWAWLAVRDRIVTAPESALRHLAPWITDSNEGTRRFASEATRPRGVWCTQIRLFRQQPQLALPLLEPLRSDPSKYVRLSVANWLNDASKDQPEWVTATAERWLAESPNAYTKEIVDRALRTLRKGRGS